MYVVSKLVPAHRPNELMQTLFSTFELAQFIYVAGVSYTLTCIYMLHGHIICRARKLAISMRAWGCVKHAHACAWLASPSLDAVMTAAPGAQASMKMMKMKSPP